MANPVLNPGFEYPGAADGQAESWTETYPTVAGTTAGTSCEHIVAYGAGSLLSDTPYDAFLGGWLLPHTVGSAENELAQTGFGIADVVAAFFEKQTYQFEAFDISWVLPEIHIPGDPVWVHQSQSSYWWQNFDPAAYDSGNEEYEDFGEDWSNNQAAVDDLEEGVSLAAYYGADNPATYDAFDVEWLDVEDSWPDFETIFVGYPAYYDTADFDSGANAYENFEGSWPTLIYP